ncbi:MAG TPA: hypothetical protein VFR97_15320 [Capillimicrobium sp.]|nr:hypothetical protein [Capillimicrobium sp.]
MSLGKPIEVRLGAVDPDGVAPLWHAVIAHGVARRLVLAGTIEGEIEVRFDEIPVPVRIVFGDDGVLVEDGSSGSADVVVSGRMADLAQLLVTPATGARSVLADPAGRAALDHIATQRVRVEGRRMLARKLLALLVS